MAFALVALSTYFFHALVNNFLTTDKFAFLFWGTAAWLLASYDQEGKTGKQEGRMGKQDGSMEKQEGHTKGTEPWPGNAMASKKKTGQCN